MFRTKIQLEKTLIGLVLIYSLANPFLYACKLENKESQTGSLNIYAKYTSLILSPNEDNIFPLRLDLNQINSEDIDVKITTESGMNWKAILCVSNQCYLHNGVTPLERRISIKEFNNPIFKIEILVPKEAKSGEKKTIRLTITASQDTKITDSIDLYGSMP